MADEPVRMTSLGTIAGWLGHLEPTEPDSDAVEAVEELLPTGSETAPYLRRFAALTALSACYNDTGADVAALLRSDVTARFDASDMLPAAVGSDLLWSQITAWINGTLALDDLLRSLDEALDIDD